MGEKIIYHITEIRNFINKYKILKFLLPISIILIIWFSFSIIWFLMELLAFFFMIYLFTMMFVLLFGKETVKETNKYIKKDYELWGIQATLKSKKEKNEDTPRKREI